MTTDWLPAGYAPESPQNRGKHRKETGKKGEESPWQFEVLFSRASPAISLQMAIFN